MPSDPVLLRLEQEAVRAAVPRGLQDDKSKQLQHELNWCYTQNNWYFTAGGYAAFCMHATATCCVLLITGQGGWRLATIAHELGTRCGTHSHACKRSSAVPTAVGLVVGSVLGYSSKVRWDCVL